MNLQDSIDFFGHFLELLIQLLCLFLEGYELLNCDVLVGRVDFGVKLLLRSPRILVGHVFASMTSFEGRSIVLKRIIRLLNLFEGILRNHLIYLMLRFLNLPTLAGLLLRRVIFLSRYSAIIGSFLFYPLTLRFLASFFC